MFDFDDIDIERMKEQDRVGKSIRNVLEKKYPLEDLDNFCDVLGILMNLVRQLMFEKYDRKECIYVFEMMNKSLIGITHMHFDIIESEEKEKSNDN